MDTLLQQFEKKYTGQANVGNTSQNNGQCVGLVSLWQDILGVPHEYGNASDLLTDANTTYFQVIQNDPNNLNQFPVTGDIMVWGTTWGGGFGHTGIVTQANGTSFSTFEQNDHVTADPTGVCAILPHNYDGVLGWLHFIGTIPQAVQSSTSSVLNTTGLNTHGLDSTNQASNQVVFDIWNDVKNGVYVSATQYQGLQGQLEALQEKYNTLQSKYSELSTENTQNKGKVVALETEDFNYAQKASDAEKIVSEYTGYMDDIATELNLSDNNQTDSQLHDEIIKEIVTLHANQQAQESQIPSEKILTNWEEHFKNIIDWLVNNGLNKYLTDNGLRIVDLEGNAQDNAIGDRVIAYLDDRFHRLDVLEQAQQALNTVKTQVVKSKNLFTQLLGLFYTKS